MVSNAPEVVQGEDAGGEATPDEEAAGMDLFLPVTLPDRKPWNVRGKPGPDVQGQGGAVHRVTAVMALNQDLCG